jgi:hypothetical protein
MSRSVQILRGTAALPPDLEEQFVRIHGREMTAQERVFFGLSFRKHKSKREQTTVDHRQEQRVA